VRRTCSASRAPSGKHCHVISSGGLREMGRSREAKGSVCSEGDLHGSQGGIRLGSRPENWSASLLSLLPSLVRATNHRRRPGAHSVALAFEGHSRRLAFFGIGAVESASALSDGLQDTQPCPPSMRIAGRRAWPRPLFDAAYRNCFVLGCDLRHD